jgi:probable rRNA maturation factor
MSENNTIHIIIEKEYRNLVDQTQLKVTAKSVLNYFNKKDFEFTISIVSDGKIRELNNNFRSGDSETDVLSFSADEINPETGKAYIGDVVISYPVAEKQSRELNHRISEELNLLTIHGVLHLLGYDHASKVEEKHMFAIQSKLIRLINEPLRKKRT